MKLEAKTKKQSLVLSSHPTGLYQTPWGQINSWFRLLVASLCWHMLLYGGYIVAALDVDVNIALFVLLCFWMVLNDQSSFLPQMCHQGSFRLCANTAAMHAARLQFTWRVIHVRKMGSGRLRRSVHREKNKCWVTFRNLNYGGEEKFFVNCCKKRIRHSYGWKKEIEKLNVLK